MAETKAAGVVARRGSGPWAEPKKSALLGWRRVAGRRDAAKSSVTGRGRAAGERSLIVPPQKQERGCGREHRAVELPGHRGHGPRRNGPRRDSEQKTSLFPWHGLRDGEGSVNPDGAP